MPPLNTRLLMFALIEFFKRLGREQNGFQLVRRLLPREQEILLIKAGLDAIDLLGEFADCCSLNLQMAQVALADALFRLL